MNKPLLARARPSRRRLARSPVSRPPFLPFWIMAQRRSWRCTGRRKTPLLSKFSSVSSRAASANGAHYCRNVLENIRLVEFADLASLCPVRYTVWLCPRSLSIFRRAGLNGKTGLTTIRLPSSSLVSAAFAVTAGWRVVALSHRLILDESGGLAGEGLLDRVATFRASASPGYPRAGSGTPSSRAARIFLPLASSRPPERLLSVDKVRVSSVTAAVHAGRHEPRVSSSSDVHCSEAIRAGGNTPRPWRVMKTRARIPPPSDGTAAVVFGA